MKIFYYCPCETSAIGGIKVIYQHVELLHNNGFEVYVLHPKNGFICQWFEHQAPIAYYKLSGVNRFRKTPVWPEKILLPSGQEYQMTDQDIVVIPEIYGPNFEQFAPGHKKVIFNQNAYYTFSNYSTNIGNLKGSYADKNIIACLCISEDTQSHLSFAFPSLPIYRVKWSLNAECFKYKKEKKPIISFMPRKNSDHAKHLINLLKFNLDLKDIEIVEIENKTEEEVSLLLRESLLFLSFGFPEGLPLPPAEAMACGCLVVGYHGNGAKEYMKPEFSYPFEIWDTVGMAETIKAILSDYKNNELYYQEKGRKASAYISQQYSKKIEKDVLIGAWKNILNTST
ncbi:glycosyltransferase [bacterium]|jgi:glycosyltransferase involved in cell wall biosynthesis|nr:glycosyltransferase [bacterium]